MFHRHHRIRAWRLIAATLTADTRAEHALAREFGEGLRLIPTLQHPCRPGADELHAQLAEANSAQSAHPRRPDDVVAGQIIGGDY